MRLINERGFACDGCGKAAIIVVELEWREGNVLVCESCLKEALALLKQPDKKLTWKELKPNDK